MTEWLGLSAPGRNMSWTGRARLLPGNVFKSCVGNLHVRTIFATSLSSSFTKNVHSALNAFLQFILNTTARGVLLNQKLEHVTLLWSSTSPKRKTRALMNGLQVLHDLACWCLFYTISYYCLIYSGKQIFLLFLGHVKNAFTSGPLQLLVPPIRNHSPNYLQDSFLYILQIFIGIFVLNPA